MKYHTAIYRRAFDAIRSGAKRVEIRTNTSYETIDYSQLQAGDCIEFSVIAGPPFVNFAEIHPERLVISVREVRHYPTAEAFFLSEGIDCCSFHPETVEEAIAGINEILENRDSIPGHGLYAIDIASFYVVASPGG